MRRLLLVSIGSLALSLAAPGRTPRAEPAQPQIIQPLPASLDGLFPPKANAPVWLLAMFEMAGSFSGMVVDFMEQDFANADKLYLSFKDQYAKLSRMVPEWTGDFPSGPVDALGEALKSRDPAKFMPAVENASKTCMSCHVQNMARVQQKYHWGDFGGLILTDPVSKGSVPWPVFMQMLDGDLAGVQVNLAEGQIDRARDHAAGLATRYVALKEACAACHSSERAYYVDEGVTGMIDKLGSALAGATVDPKGVTELLQGIGMESCHKCHMVHAPAALARYAGGPAK